MKDEDIIKEEASIIESIAKSIAQDLEEIVHHPVDPYTDSTVAYKLMLYVEKEWKHLFDEAKEHLQSK